MVARARGESGLAPGAQRHAAGRTPLRLTHVHCAPAKPDAPRFLGGRAALLGGRGGFMTTLRIAYLYPTVMNLYGDTGNIRCLQDRCQRRGIEVAVSEIGLGEPINPEGFDLMFVGGGQDREQVKGPEALPGRKGDALRRAGEAGAVALAVCGGYQLLGRFYRPPSVRICPD